MDLKRAYDAMDRGRCLKILRNVGIGEKTLRLFSRFWRESQMVCRAAGFYGTLFKARRSVTQGGHLLLTIFNLIVNVIVCEWEQQLTKKGLVFDNVRRLFACFYANNGLLTACKPGHLQLAFNFLIALFDRVNLQTNTLKTEFMVFLSGRIRTCMSEEAFCSVMDPLARGSKKGQRVRCKLCHKEFSASYLATQKNVATFYPSINKWRCPVSNCPQG